MTTEFGRLIGETLSIESNYRSYRRRAISARGDIIRQASNTVDANQMDIIAYLFAHFSLPLIIGSL